MGLLIRRRHGSGCGHALDLAQRFHIGEEECLVLENGAAGAAPELTLPVLWIPQGEEISRIDTVVSQKLVQAAVELVRPGLRQDVDHPSSRAATLGRIDIGLHPDFGDRVDRGPYADRPARANVVVQSIDQVVVQHIGLTVDGNGVRRATVVRTRAAVDAISHWWTGVGAGREER